MNFFSPAAPSYIVFFCSAKKKYSSQCLPLSAVLNFWAADPDLEIWIPGQDTSFPHTKTMTASHETTVLVGAGYIKPCTQPREKPRKRGFPTYFPLYCTTTTPIYITAFMLKEKKKCLEEETRTVRYQPILEAYTGSLQVQDVFVGPEMKKPKKPREKCIMHYQIPALPGISGGCGVGGLVCFFHGFPPEKSAKY